MDSSASYSGCKCVNNVVHREFIRTVKVKVKWSRYRPGVAQRVGRGIALLFHGHGTRKGLSGQQHAPAVLYPPESPGTHFTRGWVGPRAGLDGRKISSPPGFDPGSSSPYSVAIPTELPGPIIRTVLFWNTMSGWRVPSKRFQLRVPNTLMRVVVYFLLSWIICWFASGVHRCGEWERQHPSHSRARLLPLNSREFSGR